MRLNHLSLFQILREIDLSRIKAEADTRFSLLIAGEPLLTARLAKRLSESPGKTGIHPWVQRHTPGGVDRALPEQRFDAAMIVSSQVDLAPETSALLQTLEWARVPTLVVIVHDGAASVIGAELPRTQERARVVLPSDFDRQTLQDRLAPVFLTLVPDALRLSLGKQLPIFRGVLTHQLIADTSQANAVYAASSGMAKLVPVLNIPLNVADMVILTKNQLVMAFKIALLAGKQGRPLDIMGEAISVLGGGFLFREIARGLVGLIPGFGILPRVAVAYAGTQTIGQVVALWAFEDRRLPLGELRRRYQGALARGRKVAGALIGKNEQENAKTPAALPPPPPKPQA